MMRTFRARLVLSHALVVVLSMLILLGVIWRTLLNTAIEDAEHHLEDIGFAASNALEEPLKELLEGKRSLVDVRRLVDQLIPGDPIYVLYLPDGSALMTNDTALPTEAPPEVFQALDSTLGEADSVHRDALGQQRAYLAVRIEHEEDVYGVLFLHTALADAYRRAWGKFVGLLMVGLGLLALVVLGSLWLARSLSAPLQRIEQTARRMAAGELDARVSPTGTRETVALAQAFNHMADRIQAHVEEMRAFVANASHELRTPLTAIKLRTEALRYGGALDDPATADRFLADIERHTDRLSRMVDELLDLSRIEAGVGQQPRQPVNLAALLDEALDIYRPRVEEKGLHLHVDVMPGLPSVPGNEEQLRRVVENLLSNAIKFTPSGGRIWLRLAADPDRRRLRYEVRDSGPGIAEKHLPHLFERFYRAIDTQPGLKEVGSGLGLAIVRAVAEAHDGKVGVASRLGEGSTFWVELPY